MFSLMPSLVDPNAQSSRLDPAARLTIGKTIALGPLYGSKREFCTRCGEPYSGPRRAERAKKILANQPRAFTFSLTIKGISRAKPLAG